MASQAAQPATLDISQSAGASAAGSGESQSASAPSGATGQGDGQGSSGSAQEAELALARFDRDRFGDIPYRIDILIGSGVKTIREVLEMETGDTVVLDRQAHEPVILMIEGRVVAQAEVVSSDKGASIQVTEVGLEE